MNVLVVFMKKFFVAFLVVSFVSGCAPRSKSIKAAYVSPLAYQSYDCEQIGQEMSRVGRRASELSGQQDSTATKDAVVMGLGLVVFWPSLFFLATGENNKEEIGRLKGESEALEQTAINHRCTSVIAQIEEAKKRVDEPKEKEALVEAKMQECINDFGKSSCAREKYEKEAEEEIAAAKAEEIRSAGNMLNNNENVIVQENIATSKSEELLKQDEPLKAETLEPHVMSKLEEGSSNSTDMFKTKCSSCGNIITYKEKYAGTAIKCMQCDNTIDLL